MVIEEETHQSTSRLVALTGHHPRRILYARVASDAPSGSSLQDLLPIGATVVSLNSLTEVLADPIIVGEARGQLPPTDHDQGSSWSAVTLRAPATVRFILVRRDHTTPSVAHLMFHWAADDVTAIDPHDKLERLALWTRLVYELSQTGAREIVAVVFDSAYRKQLVREGLLQPVVTT